MNAQGQERFGRLVLVERKVGRTSDGHILSAWLCDCGQFATVAYSRVKSGTTRSCGCLMRDASSLSATKHSGRNTPEYSSWIAMRRRCLNPNDKDFPRYGGRGIGICQRWLDGFSAFRDDMGPRPARTTLDRIDGSKGYEPNNARWASAKVQGRNRRGTYTWHICGQSFGSITEAAAAFSVSEQSVWRWVHGFLDKRRKSSTPPPS